MKYLDMLFKWCQELCTLGEYEQAADIFDRVGGLEFQVIDSPDTDKPCMDHDLFTLAEGIQNGLLTAAGYRIGTDWMLAMVYMDNEKESMDFARKLIDILELPVMEHFLPGTMIRTSFPEKAS